MDHRALRGRPEGVPEKDAWQYFGIYICQAVHLTRELEGLTFEEVARRLTIKLRRPVLPIEVQNMEAGEAPLGLNMFAPLCEAMEKSPYEVTSMAERLLVRENRPDADIIRDTQEEP